MTFPSGMNPDEASLLLAIKLWEGERLSMGQAAEMAGYSERAFIEILMHRHIPVIRYSAEELEQEIIQAE